MRPHVLFGVRQGFDEYMNLVLDDAEELDVKKQARKSLGQHAIWNFVAVFMQISIWVVVFRRPHSAQRRQHHHDPQRVRPLFCVLCDLCLHPTRRSFCFRSHSALVSAA